MLWWFKWGLKWGQYIINLGSAFNPAANSWINYILSPFKPRARTIR
jgi:hypothetical protein